VTGAEKNLNSLQGLPMTFCHLDQTADRAVVELGINHPGEMDVLAGIARPNVAVVTNIGVSHIEFLGSRENIAAEKLKICAYLGPEDWAVLNAEDDMLLARKGKTPFRTLWYGFGKEADIRADDIRDQNLGQSFRVTVREPAWARGTYEAELQVPGRHNILNALAALGAALACGIAPADALAELASYGGMKRRLEIRHAGGLTIIDDAYNAIVSSVKAALDVLCRVPGRKGALLADMREVGAHSEEFHREVGEYAAALPIDYFIGFGEAIRVTEGILTDAGKTVFHAETAEDAVQIIRQVCADGDTLLVKGSLSMGLDRVVEAVCSET
jgi:UDP-N-acetylmuramoyl-tripeptide--D-alanyl-D-alanine ligase